MKTSILSISFDDYTEANYFVEHEDDITHDEMLAERIEAAAQAWADTDDGRDYITQESKWFRTLPYYKACEIPVAHLNAYGIFSIKPICGSDAIRLEVDANYDIAVLKEDKPDA